MRKVNKNITRIVAILLALVMLSACVLSGTLAKYVTQKDGTATVGFTPFGVTINTYSDLANEYDTEAEEGVVEVEVNAANSSNLIAPGTRGALACFEVISESTDVPWYIDIECDDINIGDGYKASSKLILNENGDPIDYFPILISIYRCNWDGSKYALSGSKIAYSVIRLTPDAPKGTSVGSAEEKYKLSFTADDTRCNDVDTLEATLKTSLNIAFDDMGDGNKGNAAGTKSMFIVEWFWPYDNTDTIDVMSSSSMVEQRGTGSWTEYYYQTRELDTQLAEAMKKAPNAFNITLNLTAKVSQANGVKS